MVKNMSKVELAHSIIIRNDGVAKTSDFLNAGLNKFDIFDIAKKGAIERITNGFYKLPDGELLDDGQILNSFLPEGIFFLETALYYHFYSDYTPRTLSIAVPRSISRSRLSKIPLFAKYYFVNDNIYELGKTKIEVHGRELPIYDKERTICDCFKFRNKIDGETFIKAIKAYANDNDKDVYNLLVYSEKMGIHKQVVETMRILLND